MENRVESPKATLWDGKRKDGLPQGPGKLNFRENFGTQCSGIWVDGLIDGPGKLSGLGSGELEATFSRGVANGSGTLTLKSGLRYHGNFHNGLFEGLGRIVSKHGFHYTGVFKCGKIIGKGSFFFPRNSLTIRLNCADVLEDVSTAIPLSFHQQIQNQILRKKADHAHKQAELKKNLWKANEIWLKNELKIARKLITERQMAEEAEALVLQKREHKKDLTTTISASDLNVLE